MQRATVEEVSASEYRDAYRRYRAFHRSVRQCQGGGHGSNADPANDGRKDYSVAEQTGAEREAAQNDGNRQSKLMDERVVEQAPRRRRRADKNSGGEAMNAT